MESQAASKFAQEWIDAFNRRATDEIVARCAEEVEWHAAPSGDGAGPAGSGLRGRAAVRDALESEWRQPAPGRMELRAVFAGAGSMVLQHDGGPAGSAADTIELDAAGRVRRLRRHLAAFAAPATGRGPVEWRRGGFLLSDDPRRMDLETVFFMLQATYWAGNRPRELMERALRHSICLGLYDEGRQVGFCRGVTDRATFTWVCDVIVAPDHRGQGLGKWMMECLLEHPDLQTISYALRTRDAHGLYERFGFQRVEFMRRSSNPV